MQADSDADIPLPDEGPANDDQSVDSHNIDDLGSDDEGEDLQENAER